MSTLQIADNETKHILRFVFLFFYAKYRQSVVSKIALFIFFLQMNRYPIKSFDECIDTWWAWYGEMIIALALIFYFTTYHFNVS